MPDLANESSNKAPTPASAPPFDINTMSVLDRRRIEAMVLGPMLHAFQKEFGMEQTNATARRVITEIAREQGRAFAERTGKKDLQSFFANKEPWRRNGALEITVLEETAETYSFNVTRCRYAEMYRQLGMGDLGDIFSCTRDFEFIRGFNPDVKLTRTQTIMKGAPHCDFRYELRHKELRRKTS
ncbi:MAG: hypothetical protein EXR57_02295 [Dehalococcoidia bacterium]|nr:hypothetical protein [Dehalococcoidia bacterium]MSQ34633.1 hypothetical protein [Dehalococcoidia bacterium]